MKTQINWNASEQNDWTGIELIDTETGETHATIDACTPEALALIAAAPVLLMALKWAVEQIADDLDPDHQAAVDECRQAIAKGEGGGA